MSCALIDRFGRTIRYLRLSVTDRCDLRCVYCMAEDMQFVPRREPVLDTRQQGTQRHDHHGAPQYRDRGADADQI